MKIYDIAVAGAGPGGATAAYYCAKAGLDVVLIDKDTFPRSKPCGGGLCPHVTKFDFVDKKYFSVPSQVSTFYSASMKEKAEYSPGRPIFYNVERKEFDNHLCEKAQEAGAEFLQGVTINGVERNENGLVVKTSGEDINAKVVIGATGTFGPVSKFVRNENSMIPKWKDSQLAFALMTEIPIGEEEIVKHYGQERRFLAHFLEPVHGGYGWVFPKKDKINVGIGAEIGVIKAYGPKKAFIEYLEVLRNTGYLPKNLPDYDLKGGMLPYRGPISSTVCDNALLVGDSAGFVSPISGEGIYFAMDSGRIAADVLKTAIKKNDAGKKMLSAYHNECMRAWGKDLHLLVKFHKLLIDNMERTLRYASRDPALNEMVMDVLTFNNSPGKLKGPIFRRMMKDFLKYDVLRMK